MNYSQRHRQQTSNGPISTGPLLQRKCGCGGSCGGCDEKKKKLQRSPHAGVGVQSGALAPPIVRDVLHSSGEPLDRSSRDFFEPRFGRDFSKVRVHRDSVAAASAEAVYARAYTVGSHVVLGRDASKETLAHELVHTIQQDSMSGNGQLTIGPSGDSFEQQADTIAASVMSYANTFGGRPVSSTGAFHPLQRQSQATVGTGMTINPKIKPAVADATRVFIEKPIEAINYGPSVCPIGGRAPRLTAPEPPLASKSLCRGACGADCEPNACKNVGQFRLRVPAKLPMHHHVCTYNNLRVCGTHAGCREHDDCYDKVAAGGEKVTSGPKHRGCDCEAIAKWGLFNTASWTYGGGPYDGFLFFSDHPIATEAQPGAAVEPSKSAKSAGTPK